MFPKWCTFFFKDLVQNLHAMCEWFAVFLALDVHKHTENTSQT